jgi:hypothetical protein
MRRTLQAFVALLFLLLFTMTIYGQLDQNDMAANLEEAFTFTKYPTYPQYLQMMHYFTETYPEICRLDTIGTTGLGRLLLALKISDHAHLDEPEAGFLYTSSIHGDELVGYPLMLRLADHLLTQYGTDPEVTRLVDSLAIWINPLANPDGTYYPDNDASLAQSRRENSKGIDLNRDFPDPAGREPDDTTGRAVETRAMMEFLGEHRFTLSANFHSGAEVVNYPWDHTYERHADDDWYRFVCREYADEARAVDPDYMALFLNGITNGADWYVIYGGRQDYVNYYLGGREITVELAEAYRLESGLLEAFWIKNERSLLNYMAQCMYGIRGTVTDSTTGEPVRARIAIPGHDSAYSVVYSSAVRGDYYRLIAEGVYDLEVSATGYLTKRVQGVTVENYAATRLNIGLVPLGATGSGPDSAVPSFQIHPNPASDRIYIESRHMPEGPCHLAVISLDGRVHMRCSFPASEQPMALETGSLPAGLYILSISADQFTYRLRFIKE